MVTSESNGTASEVSRIRLKAGGGLMISGLISGIESRGN